MGVFKCKMCGGDLAFQEGASVAECSYCGIRQTLPRLDSEQRKNLYDRANHLRRNNEYDKAMNIYEKILEENPADAEAYWSLVLCRYGIEYVSDPGTGKRVPTVNRVQYTSVYADEDYKAALQHADAAQKEVYEAEAAAIDVIQKEILSISEQEEPFDVFICYKETDREGRRTPDSVLANELYYELTEAGYKVFFSRITLEKKIGTEYEPYIFAALNSAKVMVVLGTKPEYFNAVWVRNEWSRFLALIKSGKKKTLVPAYRDMDPYDLPEEFSHLQAQDMSKLGFMQDLLRGIQKIIGENTAAVPEKPRNSDNQVNIEPLLKRLFMFLEDGEFETADRYCEQILDTDPECAQAYLGKLMAVLHIRRPEEIAESEQPLDDMKEYQKVLRFAAPELKGTIEKYNQAIKEQIEQARLEGAYTLAKAAFENACTQEQYREAADLFQAISGFQDADTYAAECLLKAEEVRKDAIYDHAVKNDDMDILVTEREAAKLYESIPGWRDADERLAACRIKLVELEAQEEQRRQAELQKEEEKRQSVERLHALQKKQKDELLKKKAERTKKLNKWIKIVLSCIFATVCLAVVTRELIIPNVRLYQAQKLCGNGQYEAALEKLEGINQSFKSKVIERKYDIAVKYQEEKNYEPAFKLFDELNEYKDCKSRYLSIEEKYICQSEPGDVVLFGKYKQNDGNSPIEWIVLDKTEDQVLLLSKYGLDTQEYSDDSQGAWEESAIRTWLNDSFLYKAFSEEEAEVVMETWNVENSPDRVFLLNKEEVLNYFPSESDRVAEPTRYVIGQSNQNYMFHWWLRGDAEREDTRKTDGVNKSGEILENINVEIRKMVRPAIWVKISE